MIKESKETVKEEGMINSDNNVSKEESNNEVVEDIYIAYKNWKKVSQSRNFVILRYTSFMNTIEGNNLYALEEMKNRGYILRGILYNKFLIFEKGG